MTLPAIFVMAVALAMDAFAVAVSTGIRMQRLRVAQVGRMAGVFGFFQFIMPVAGWFLGLSVQKYIEAYDHWLAFGLLAFVGLRMLKEAWDNRSKPEDECAPYADPTTGGTLLLLGIATSIDALAVGLSMALLKTDIWLPAVIIGAVCFCITAFGMQLGRWVCKAGSLGGKANALGGLVLVSIGLGILHDHGMF